MSAVLFGLSHGTNVLFRSNVTLVGAQMFGSFCDGVGMAALTLAMGTIWPAVVLHAVHDLFLQLGPLPVAAVSAVYDTVLLVFGLVVLRRLARERKGGGDRVLASSDQPGSSSAGSSQPDGTR